MNKAIDKFMTTIDASCDSTGEKYLRELIVLYDKRRCCNVTDLYREVAFAHRRSWHTPEKKVRRLIARTHKSGTLFALNDLFGVVVIDEYPPTVKNLLALLDIYITICRDSNIQAAAV